MTTSLFFSWTQIRSQKPEVRSQIFKTLIIGLLITFSFATSPLMAQDDNVGIDQPNPQEKLDVNGAIRIGTTANDNEGTIRYENGDFEGRTPNGWESFTEDQIGGGGNSVWSLDGNTTYYNDGNVGIGTASPDASLEIENLLSERPLRLTGQTSSILQFKTEDAFSPDWELGGSGNYFDISSYGMDNFGGPLYTHFTIHKTTGYVGINDISPSEQLDVGGAIRIGTTANNGLGTLRYENGDFEGRTANGWQSLTPNGYWTKSGTNLYSDNGIIINGTPGEVAAVYDVEVRDGHIGIIEPQDGDLNGFIFAKENFPAPTVSVNQLGGMFYYHDSTDLRLTNHYGKITLRTNTNGTTPVTRMSIMEDGKVGIGTDMPTGHLTVTTDLLSVIKANGNDDLLADININATDTDAIPRYSYSKGNIIQASHGIDDNGAWQLKTYEALLLQEDVRLHVERDGNTGIGTTNPIRHVDINDADDPDKTVMRLTHDQQNRIEFKNANAGLTDWTLVAGGEFFDLTTSTEPLVVDDYRMTVRDNGNVGIDATFPTSKLQVGGDAAKPGGGSWSVASDQRLKTDINPYQDGLESVLKIKPVTFRYNGKMDLPTEEEYVGIIAQEMQQIAPYTVTEKTYKSRENPEKEEQFLSFDGSALTFMLINAVKEQQAQIEKLEQRLAELEKQ